MCTRNWRESFTHELRKLTLCQQVGTHTHGQFWWCSKPPLKPTHQHISVHLHPLFSPLSPTRVCSRRAYWYKHIEYLFVGGVLWKPVKLAPWSTSLNRTGRPLALKSFTLVALPLLLPLLDRYRMTMWSSPWKVSFLVLYLAWTI